MFDGTKYNMIFNIILKLDVSEILKISSNSY